MVTITLALLTGVCGLLTVFFLATLRGITELRLRLAGHVSDSSGFVDAGRPLPRVLVEALTDKHEVALIVFVSDECGACKELLTLAREIPVTKFACIVGRDGGDVRQHLELGTLVAAQAVSAAAARELQISATPFAILQRDGLVVGSAFGVSTQTSDELQRWWQNSQALMKESSL